MSFYIRKWKNSSSFVPSCNKNEYTWSNEANKPCYGELNMALPSPQLSILPQDYECILIISFPAHLCSTEVMTSEYERKFKWYTVVGMNDQCSNI